MSHDLFSLPYLNLIYLYHILIIWEVLWLHYSWHTRTDKTSSSCINAFLFWKRFFKHAKNSYGVWYFLFVLLICKKVYTWYFNWMKCCHWAISCCWSVICLGFHEYRPPHNVQCSKLWIHELINICDSETCKSPWDQLFFQNRQVFSLYRILFYLLFGLSRFQCTVFVFQKWYQQK